MEFKKMPSCDFCGTDRVKTYECKECDKEFCVSCGKSHKNICNNCFESKRGKGSTPLNIISGLFRKKK
jgi:hypothetical protein